LLSALLATLVHEKPCTSFFQKVRPTFFIFSKNSEALFDAAQWSTFASSGLLHFKVAFPLFRRVSIGAEVTYY